MVTTSYPGPINYQDAGGHWQPIDNSLVAGGSTGYAFTNKANAYALQLPRDLAQSPVRVLVGGQTIEWKPVGASGSPKAAKSTATYERAFPETRLQVTALNQGVKEQLTLLDSSAPTRFVYDVSVGSNLTLRANAGGGIDIVDRSGHLHAGFDAPFMYDSSQTPAGRSNAVTLKLAGSTSANVAGNQQLILEADHKWLADPNRKWPVVIDPALSIFTGSDCFIESGPSASSNMCTSSATTTRVGASSSAVDRSLMFFDFLNSISSKATIMNARLGLYATANQTGHSVPIELHQVNESWTTAASWNTRDGVNAWQTVGGSFASTAAWTTNVSATGLWYYWYFSPLAQDWDKGASSNFGVLLKESNESAVESLQFYSSRFTDSSFWPTLTIEWQPMMGERSFYTMERHQLTDRSDLAVNVVSGIPLIHAHDLTIHGVGLDLNIDRYYNYASWDTLDVGAQWTFNTGFDVWLDTDDGDGVSFIAPSGFAVHFLQNGNSFITPPGLDARLVKNADNSYTITYNQSGEKLNFFPPNTAGDSFLKSDVDRNGNTISFAYDANGALASITDTEGRVTTISYNPLTCGPTASGVVSKITDPAGRQYQYGYDGTCHLTSYTDPDNHLTQYGYASNQITITDPLGNVTKVAVDPTMGKATSITYVTDPATGTGPTTSFTYNSTNTVVTDANGHQTTSYYDVSDHNKLVQKVVDALGHTRQSSYTSNYNVASLTDAMASQNVTRLNYDTNFNLTSLQAPPSAGGQTPATTYLSYGAPGQTFLPSSRTDAQNNCRAHSYDSAGNLTDTYDGQTPSGSPPQCDGLTGGAHYCNAYQGNPSGTCGATSTVTCPNAKNGELCWTKDPVGNKTSYAYDTNGNLRSITPPSPLGGTTVTVDSVSRIQSVTDGNNNTTTYSYDKEDRITQILYGGATTCTPGSSTCTTFQYDGDGNLKQRQDNTGITAFSYDALNRLKNKALPDTTVACTGSVPAGLTFGYDAVGNLTSYCDVGGTTNYGYDVVNRVTGLAEPGGSLTASGTCATNPCTGFSYDNDDRRTQASFPGGASLNLTYDGAGNQTSAIGKDSASNVLTSFTYTYTSGTTDRALRQTMSEADAVATRTTTYTYDAFNRLTDATPNDASPTYHYRYDANGNRCRTDTSACQGASDPYQYNAANELTASPGVSSWSYNGNGNVTANSAGASLSYNAKNQTTAITYGGTTLSGLAYADVDQTERTAAGSMSFAASPLGVMVAKSGASSTYYVRDNIGNIIGERTPDGNQSYYLSDGLGSIVAVINNSGSTVANRYGYDPYGKSTYKSETITNPWQYAGGYLDPTGLTKFGMRYYDPNLGRWTQQDPVAGAIGAPSTINRYIYVGCNPINARDPSGAASFGGCALVGGTLLLGTGLAGIKAGILVGALISGLSDVTGLGLFLTFAGLAGAAFGLGVFVGVAIFAIIAIRRTCF